jgi:hypothetical protein
MHSLQLSGNDLPWYHEIKLKSMTHLQTVALKNIRDTDFAMVRKTAPCDAVTHISLLLGPKPDVRTGRRLILPPWPPLPKLRSLHIEAEQDPTSMLPLPSTLQELRLPSAKCDPAALDNLTMLTSLTMSLHLDSWQPYEALASLTTLKRLEITGPTVLIPCIAELTSLTHLSWAHKDDRPFHLAPFTRLQNLEHLGIKGSRAIGVDHFSPMVAMTGLKSLALDCTKLCVNTLHTLFQLTALALPCRKGAHVVEGMNLEGLKDLTLKDGYQLTDDELAALQRATGLTRLDFTYNACYTGSEAGFGSRGAAIWRANLSQMPQLQSLALRPGPLGEESLFESIGSLTRLTKMEWRGGNPAAADVAHCARLTNLRSLTLLPRLPRPDILRYGADQYMPLAELPELRSLEVCREWNVGMVEDLVAKINKRRYSRGWPSLRIHVSRGRICAS